MLSSSPAVGLVAWNSMSGGICAVLTESELVVSGFGVAGMILIIVEMRYVRCACVVFFTGRQSGSVT